MADAGKHRQSRPVDEVGKSVCARQGKSFHSRQARRRSPACMEPLPRIRAANAKLVAAARAELKGKNLACWCPAPEPYEHDCCHASVLLKIANADDCEVPE